MKNRRARKRDDTSAKGKASKRPRKEPKKATSGIFNSIEYDSLEELYVLQWLFELKSTGYITSIKRSESFLLCDSVVNNYAEQMKKVSSRPKTQTILHGHSYTPEFVVVWNWQKARDKFLDFIDAHQKMDKSLICSHYGSADYITYIEVKPMWDQNNMERLFKLNQKWMWDKHAIFVNLVKVGELFPRTFTPKAYLTTPTGRPRMLRWKPRSLFDFINNK